MVSERDVVGAAAVFLFALISYSEFFISLLTDFTLIHVSVRFFHCSIVFLIYFSRQPLF